MNTNNISVEKLKSGKIIDTLSSMKNSMTRVSQKIVDYIQANPNDATQLSIAQFSEKTHAGEATIVRFCRSLGYKGFQDFKMHLAIELATKDVQESTLFDTDIHHEDDVKKIGLKLQSTLNEILAETLNLIDPEQLEHAKDQLSKANYIAIFGVGSSGIAAEAFKNKLMRIGHRVDAISNTHFMYMQASLLKPNDVAIAITQSGNSPEAVNALKIAKEAGATCIAITHHLGSSIIEYADYYLINGSKQGKLQGDSIGTITAQLFTLDLLYTLLIKGSPEELKGNKIKTLNALQVNNSI